MGLSVGVATPLTRCAGRLLHFSQFSSFSAVRIMQWLHCLKLCRYTAVQQNFHRGGEGRDTCRNRRDGTPMHPPRGDAHGAVSRCPRWVWGLGRGAIAQKADYLDEII